MRTPIALVLVALAACQSGPKAETESMGAAPPAAAAEFSAADEAAIREADQAWAKATSAGDAAAITAFYASDAVLMPPGSPAIKGSEEIGKFFTGMTSAVSGPFELKTTAVQGNGDLALSTGEYTATLTPRQKGAKPLPVEHGKYLGVMRKQSDGSWKLIYDIWNTNGEAKH